MTTTSQPTSYREFTPAPRPPGIPARPVGRCIGNTVETTLQTGLGYAEGIALEPSLGLWFRHAWNVTPSGDAVDVTWAEPAARYIGREYTTRRVLDQAITREAYDYLDNPGPPVPDGGCGIDCLTSRERDWIAVQMTTTTGGPS